MRDFSSDLDGAFARTTPPWAARRGLPALLDAWRDDGGIWRNVALHHVIEGREGRYADLPETLDPRVREALIGRGIDRLYAHQAAAFDAVRAGEHVVVATPTASGKSLCYHLPVLDRFAREPDARALY